MQLHDEIAALFERPRGIRRFEYRHLARRPAEHVLHVVLGHRRKAWPGVGAIEPACHARWIDRDVGVMQHLRVVGAELDRANVSRRRARHREDEVAEDFTLAGLKRVGLGALDDDIRCSQLPALGKRRRLRLVRCVALGCALLGPLLNQCDLIVAAGGAR